MTAALAAFETHLAVERDLSAHTVRAYLADVTSLATHAARLGITEPAGLDLRTLRSWLANQQVTGRSRTTLARRATAARVFTAWLARNPQVGTFRTGFTCDLSTRKALISFWPRGVTPLAATTTMAARLPLRCTVRAHTAVAAIRPPDHSQDLPKCR